MEHLEVLREKIAGLRSEIAQLQELNERYRRERGQDASAHVAHGQRQERLLEIQQELTLLARLGGRGHSGEEMKGQQRSRLLLENCSICASPLRRPGGGGEL